MAVRFEDIDFLQSVGFDMRTCSYEKALALLYYHYYREENTFIKTPKSVLVSKMASEGHGLSCEGKTIRWRRWLR